MGVPAWLPLCQKNGSNVPLPPPGGRARSPWSTSRARTRGLSIVLGSPPPLRRLLFRLGEAWPSLSKITVVPHRPCHFAVFALGLSFFPKLQVASTPSARTTLGRQEGRRAGRAHSTKNFAVYSTRHGPGAHCNNKTAGRTSTPREQEAPRRPARRCPPANRLHPPTAGARAGCGCSALRRRDRACAQTLLTLTGGSAAVPAPSYRTRAPLTRRASSPPLPLLYFVCLSHAWGVLHNGPERTSVPLSVARPPERSPRLFRAASP